RHQAKRDPRLARACPGNAGALTMLRLGLTGSIATGKSTLLKAFADLGVPTFSADEAVAELYAGPAVVPVEALFPGVTQNGIIDRSLLSQKLAADPSGFA